ncbi:hypothetical protein MKK69_03770 [Methylobacterium sp. J-026]|uniref:hypothetical protein n=1 Tax=Methylobacterium sp. J-026 TaxID=2836624 RepID=UPI001FBBBAFC|nr:hypothetical protein [Methylobacterium sp. J-026]MCJ2133190.1 hypothetical protein [Methylobacterium sp. J-026]
MTKRVVDGARTSQTRRDGRDGLVEVRALRRPSLFLALVLAGPACAQAPSPAPVAPASPLDGYAEAAATTIIAEQSCPGVQVKAGQLTTLRLGARVNAGQETVLQEKLRTRASQVRQQLAADGREAWCAGALAAFGPQGSVARGILATGAPIR